jgi:hypothetical protein
VNREEIRTRLRRHHIIEDRKVEIIIAIGLFIFASLLMFDAFDARGKKLPWPASAIMPW